MKKSLIFILSLILVFAFIRIATSTYENKKREDNLLEQNQETVTNETEISGDITTIPVDSIKGITSQEAEKLCYSIMGEKDEKTGFLFSFGTSGAVKKEGKQYYVIRASWLVDNNHLSYIGDFFVSADGKEVYTGTALSGEYTMENVIWRE